MRFALLAAAAVSLIPLVGTSQEIPKAGSVIPPQPVRTVKAAYTLEARRARVEGIVLVDAIVLADGRVGADVTVTQSLDRTFGLDEAAVEASKRWTFRPATQDGKPVSAHVVIEHVFSLGGEK
jgi:periplasmic protein TonB